MDINAGDTKLQVIKKVGSPENRQFSKSNQAFQYCTTGTSFGTSTFHIIWFQKGQVTGVNTYSLRRPGLCPGSFKEIQWKNAPHKIIEFRNS
ncbi:hypothetical protein [Piscirickettsia salmonis]|uniref:hypothetical protein n=1 Tax=Piscirickettsia salmonis TaxID=1238 RepID=UPI003EBF70D7